MNAVLLSLHVLAAIIAIGPICVAASMFPAEARRALGDHAATRLVVLARISRVYAAVGIAVPVLGMMTAASMDVLSQTWVIVSMGLTLVAALVLAFVVLPRQQSLLADVTAHSGAGAGADVAVIARQKIGGLAMATGVFNLLWAAVTVLMIVRPGSTTGV
ncbi:DUF2269 family protein [Pseudonocardia sp. MH-G8]|uniref:DUF2269 family protein n=1 Tax=Pseudonocardia sp. MH-G8 TaxID=1854588 RepID=UPI000BA0EDF5|nr:DUF2269 family protein [Pseudonocardia sp. MH-G8]OZM76465.1 hypothetical protein CFP66_40760 [Pseudonocardia sp. MH-G8]